MAEPESGRELAAALTAAGGQDRTTGTGPHPQPETVRAGTPAVVRLIGALAHGRYSWSLRRHRMVRRCQVDVRDQRLGREPADTQHTLRRRATRAGASPPYAASATMVNPQCRPRRKSRKIKQASPTEPSVVAATPGLLAFTFARPAGFPGYRRNWSGTPPPGRENDSAFGSMHSLWISVWTARRHVRAACMSGHIPHRARGTPRRDTRTWRSL